MTDDLSPEARRLIDRAEGGWDPTPGQSRRVQVALSAALAAGVTASAGTSAAAAAGAKAATGSGVVSGLGLLKVLGSGALVVSLGVGATVVAVSSQSPQRPPPRVPTSASASVAPSSLSPAPTASGHAPSVVAEAAPSGATGSVPSPSRPSPSPGPSTLATRLDEEARALEAAESALRAGDHGRARRLLQEQTRRFPDGQLGPERDAVATIARCRTAGVDRRAALRRFLAAHPGSPARGRVTAACQSSSPASPAAPSPEAAAPPPTAPTRPLSPASPDGAAPRAPGTAAFPLVP